MTQKSFLTRCIPVLAICLAFLPIRSQAEEKAAHLSKTDKAFMAEAYQGGLSEVKVGTLAQTKATTPEARTLAERLVADHEKANTELKSLAESKGMTLPTEPKQASQSTYGMLEKKEGAAFDKAFAMNAVKDHQKDISHFEKAAKETKDSDLKNFIEKTLPVLKEHLSLAEAANKK